MTRYSSHAALDPESRRPKAEKIRRLLLSDKPGALRGSLLEIGTGSGVISSYLAASAGDGLKVSAVDVEDQRIECSGFAFQTYDGKRLPFEAGTFDFVVSNHVVEHVGDRAAQSRHLSEIHRVLREGGCAYLATPSRWQFIEPHFRLAGLSWILRALRDPYVRLAGKGSRYDCDPMSHAELEKMLDSTGFEYRNKNAAALSIMLESSPNGTPGRILAAIPDGILQRTYRLSPTMIYLLAKRQTDAA